MNDSILLITSQDPTNKKMGTGFVVHQDAGGSYVLTCKHVVDAVIEPKINGYEAFVKFQDELIDLALLYVKELYIEPLKLKSQSIAFTKDVQFIGYENWSDYNPSEPKDAEVITKLNFQSKKDVLENISHDEWKIKVNHDNHSIEEGNSGSPLICLKTNKVIGVIRYKRNKTTWGYAVDVVHLKNLWKNIPRTLLLQEKKENPFVGLRAFTKNEKQFFFGRDKEIEEISNKLNREGFVAVVGDSGSGKSSIIKAGIIPRYEEEGYCVLEMRPANNPYGELSSELKNTITVSDNSMMIQKLYEYCENKETKLLFYIDQFEELVTGNQIDTKDFLEMLLYLRKPENQRSKLKIHIIYTMRRDYIPLLKKYDSFYKLVNNQEYLVEKMEAFQLKEVISKPLTYENAFSKEEAEKFADFVLFDMRNKSKALTLLQIALMQTWFKHKEGDDLADAYQEIGGVENALTTHTFK